VELHGHRLPRGPATLAALGFGFAVLVAVGWAFGAAARGAFAGPGDAWPDQGVLDWMAAHRQPWLTTTAQVVAPLGNSVVLVPVALVAGLVLAARRGGQAVLGYLAATYLGAELLFQAVKTLTDRPRPPADLAVSHWAGSSFPSGHAVLTAAMLGALALTVGHGPARRRRGVLIAGAAVLTVVISATRIYLGAHWLSDVVAGWALGTAWLAVTTVALGPDAGDAGDAAGAGDTGDAAGAGEISRPVAARPPPARRA
jgi:undecaprenyl-diphosphatase